LTLRIHAFGSSHVGLVRKRNEDTMVVESSLGILIVADGMGGTPAGDLASSTAAGEALSELTATGDMREAVLRANRRIVSMTSEQPDLKGMGTTLTALQVSSETGAYVVGHVGDSRAYLLSGEAFVSLSKDHTAVREMVEKGQIPPEAERNHHLSHVLTRAVGTREELVVDLEEGTAEPGDLFLLCSDGLEKVMETPEVGEWARRMVGEAMEATVEALVQEVIARGAPDNITVACLQILPDEETPSALQ